jgi:hypothetical protein
VYKKKNQRDTKMDAQTLQNNFVQAVLYYCGVTNSDPNRYFGYDPDSLSPSIGAFIWNNDDPPVFQIDATTWLLPYPAPTNVDLATPTLSLVTAFYNSAYRFPQQIINSQTFAQMSTVQIAATEVDKIPPGSMVMDVTQHQLQVLANNAWGTPWLTSLTGVVTSVGNLTSIANGALTNQMLANAAVGNLSGTNTGDQKVNASNGFGAASGSTLTLSVSVSGLLSGSSGAIVSATDSQITSALLTGLNATAGTIQATDSLLVAFNKAVNALNGSPFLPLAGGTMAGPIGGVTTLTASTGGQLILNGAANRVDIGPNVDFYWPDMAMASAIHVGGPVGCAFNPGQILSVPFSALAGAFMTHFTLNTSTGLLTYTGTTTKKMIIVYTFSVIPNVASVSGTLQSFININSQTSALTSSQVRTTVSWPAVLLTSATLQGVTVRQKLALNTNDTIALGGYLSTGSAQTVNYYDISVDIEALPN